MRCVSVPTRCLINKEVIISKVKKIEVLGNYEIWSLLDGYGPNERDRPPRYMSEEERAVYVLGKLRESTNGISPTRNIRLVIEVKDK